jgi:hypothetical protein
MYRGTDLWNEQEFFPKQPFQHFTFPDFREGQAESKKKEIREAKSPYKNVTFFFTSVRLK